MARDPSAPPTEDGVRDSDVLTIREHWKPNPDETNPITGEPYEEQLGHRAVYREDQEAYELQCYDADSVLATYQIPPYLARAFALRFGTVESHAEWVMGSEVDASWPDRPDLPTSRIDREEGEPVDFEKLDELVGSDLTDVHEVDDEIYVGFHTESGRRRYLAIPRDGGVKSVPVTMVNAPRRAKQQEE